jgi:RHS repeat-associated protein
MMGQYKDGITFMVHQNALGSTAMLTGPAGEVKSDFVFFPYGDLWKAGPAYEYHFAGFDFHGGWGWYGTNARPYHWDLGSWLSPDKLGGDVTNPQSLNRYAYVLNNPASLTDPLGLQTRTCGRNELKIPDGENPLSYCKTHMGFYGGNSPAAFFSNTSDEFDLLGPTYIDNGEGGLMQAGITNGAEVANALSNSGGFFGDGESLSYQLGTWKLQTKVFVSTLGQNFVDEFKKGGCVNAFLEGAEGADVLGPALSGSPNIAETNVNALANSVAVSYAAGRLLTVPFRSSTVRSILNTGETAAEYFAPVYLNYLALSGLGKEALAMYHGKCQ